MKKEALRFVLIIAAVGIVLGSIASTDPEVRLIQRSVADHTAMIVSITGIPTQVYYHWVSVPTQALSEQETKEIKLGLGRITMALQARENALIGMKTQLPQVESKALDEYVNRLRQEGIAVEFSPAMISTPGLDMGIVPACTGWLAIAAITALVLAYPRTTEKARLYGLILGWGGLYAFNIFRLSTTLWLVNFVDAGLFDVLHVFLWREAMVGTALVLWYVWLKNIATVK